MYGISNITSCRNLVLLFLALTGFDGKVYSSPTPMSITDLLQQVIEAHYYAIGENRLDEAMGYYHSQSPEIVQTRENIVYGFSQYLLRTTTMSFCYAGQEDEFAVVTAKHRYLMISGIKFIEHIVDVDYQLRREQESWKIWTQRDSSNVSSSC